MVIREHHVLGETQPCLECQREEDGKKVMELGTQLIDARAFRPWCSEKYEGNPTPAIARDEWFADVMAFFGLVGVKWDEEHTSEKGVVHFHERI